MEDLTPSWENLTLDDPLPLSFCTDPAGQHCSRFPDADTVTGACSPLDPGSLHTLTHNRWIQAFPCAFGEGDRFWIVLEDLGVGFEGRTAKGPIPVWAMTVQDASWPAITTEEVCQQTECLQVDTFLHLHVEDEEPLWDESTFDGLLPLIPPGQRANGIMIQNLYVDTVTAHFFGGGLFDFDPIASSPEWPENERLWVFHKEPWIMISVESRGYSGLKLATFTPFEGTLFAGGLTSSSTIYSLDSRWPALGPLPTTNFRQITANLAFVAPFPADYQLEDFIVIGEAYAPSGPAFLIP